MFRMTTAAVALFGIAAPAFADGELRFEAFVGKCVVGLLREL